MNNGKISERDRKRAKRCVECPCCRHARAKQSGIIFHLVKSVETWLCPYCKAYKKVYGRKAHERLPEVTDID